jgi:hypothetical protein
MKGNNTLILNEATMIEAVQFWLDSKIVPSQSPKVTSVKHDKTDAYSDCFKVLLLSEDK